MDAIRIFLGGGAENLRTRIRIADFLEEVVIRVFFKLEHSSK
jgi:hypothetical protein